MHLHWSICLSVFLSVLVCYFLLLLVWFGFSIYSNLLFLPCTFLSFLRLFFSFLPSAFFPSDLLGRKKKKRKQHKREEIGERKRGSQFLKGERGKHLDMKVTVTVTVTKTEIEIEIGIGIEDVLMPMLMPSLHVQIQGQVQGQVRAYT